MRRTPTSQWIPLLAEDMGQVNTIADAIHPGLPEAPEVFLEKQSLFPRGCLKLLVDNTIVGYGIAHPWTLYNIPPLDEFMHRLPVSPDCMYVHDVAILTKARGENGAVRFIEEMTALAHKLKLAGLACVSVYGTDRLWSRCGFEIQSSRDLDKKLESYGDSAKYMIARI